MIYLFTIGFGRTDLIQHQRRLLFKYLQDDHRLICVDNTPGAGSYAMQELCSKIDVGYYWCTSEKRLHNEALNQAAMHASMISDCEYFGFLDHDVFPRRETTLIDKIQKAGFYGVAQSHPPTGHQYLWPGFCFFSKSWLNGRQLNFDGIRGPSRREDGDTGSMNWPLFADEDWQKMWGMEHGYKAIREPDNEGMQSWAIEILGDFIHFTNASNWKAVPDPQNRDKILLEILEDL